VSNNNGGIISALVMCVIFLLIGGLIISTSFAVSKENISSSIMLGLGIVFISMGFAAMFSMVILLHKSVRV